MKVTITESYKEHQGFPKLMRSTKTGAIFLIIEMDGDSASGIVLQNPNNDRYDMKWAYSEHWNLELLEPFHGKVEIEY